MIELNQNPLSNSNSIAQVYLPRRTQRNRLLWIVFVLLHIPLCLAMNTSTIFSTGHALITMIVGGYISITTRELRKVAWITAYICGAELLWRMTGANVFWEFGKYAIVALMCLRLLRIRSKKSVGLPIMFFGLLAISIPLTLFNLNFNDAREAISFNLSGPLSLAVSVLFFFQVQFTWDDLSTLIWYLVTPILGIAAICLQGIITAEEISFSSNSNFTTSGGFGPNQISAILGLGALLLFLLAVKLQSARQRLISLGMALSPLTLSALTLSRGGYIMSLHLC